MPFTQVAGNTNAQWHRCLLLLLFFLSTVSIAIKPVPPNVLVLNKVFNSVLNTLIHSMDFQNERGNRVPADKMSGIHVKIESDQENETRKIAQRHQVERTLKVSFG